MGQQEKHYHVALTSCTILSLQEVFGLYYDELVQLSLFGDRIEQIVGKHYFKNTKLEKISKWQLSADNLFWYNLHHVVDDDIIFDKQALCIQVHLAQICNIKDEPRLLNLHSLSTSTASKQQEDMPSPSATVEMSPSVAKSLSPS